jgi:hypothetical protein
MISINCATQIFNVIFFLFDGKGQRELCFECGILQKLRRTKSIMIQKNEFEISFGAWNWRLRWDRQEPLRQLRRISCFAQCLSKQSQTLNA